jgi:hypothetical protein
MSTIEKLQVLIRSDKITERECVAFTIKQGKLLAKLPEHKRIKVLESLYYIEPRILTRREIELLKQEIELEIQKRPKPKVLKPKKNSIPALYHKVKKKQTKVTIPDNLIITLARQGRCPEAIAGEYRQPLYLIKRKFKSLSKYIDDK